MATRQLRAEIDRQAFGRVQSRVRTPYWGDVREYADGTKLFLPRLREGETLDTVQVEAEPGFVTGHVYLVRRDA